MTKVLLKIDDSKVGGIFNKSYYGIG